LIPALLLLIVAAAPAVVWSAAQTVLYERLILISEKGPKEFQLGNNPLANGTYNEPLAGMIEPAGIDYIRAFPLDALRLAGRKVLYSFGILRDGWNVPHPPAVWIWRATTGAVPLSLIEPIVAGGWLLAVVLVAIAMLGEERRRRWWVVTASVVVILAVHVITLSSYRFAIPLLPALYVLASGPLATLARSIAHALRVQAIAAAVAVIALASLAAQFQSWPLEARYRAAALDGIAAHNQVDEVSRAMARVGNAKGGERPIALLPDTYMPRGRVRVTVSMRRTSPDAADGTPVARVGLVPLHGGGPCVSEVFAAQLTDRFSEIALLCQLDRDGPVTLAVFSLGQLDLSVDSVRLVWIR
jgi:hypothetical protein